MEGTDSQTPHLILFDAKKRLDPVEGSYDSSDSSVNFEMPDLEDFTTGFYFQVIIRNKGYPIVGYEVQPTEQMTIKYDLNTDIKPAVTLVEFDESTNVLKLTGLKLNTDARIIVKLTSSVNSNINF